MSPQPLPSDARIAESMAQRTRETLDALAAAGPRPAAMAAFDSLFGEDWRVQQIAADPRPVVGYLCNFVPEELVLAAGAIPLRLDVGHSAAAEAGARVLAQDICPEVRSIVGAQLGDLPYFRRVDLLVLPTACDGKKKLARILSGETWILELPQTRDGPRSQQLWREQVQAFAGRLRQLTGRRVKRGPLRQAVKLLNRRTELARRINRLRRDKPGCLSGQDALLAFQASFVADAGWWVERAAELAEELERAPAPEGRKPLPVLLTGSPILFPDFKLVQILERAGGLVVADELCSGTQRLHNPTVVDEWSVGGMLRAVADKTLLPCTCPCFAGTGDGRLDRLLTLAEDSRARGVVHHTLRLCQPFDMEQPAVAAALKERGLPLLNIHTDYGSEDAAVINNRVEAFLEMLRPGL
jgi:benzoyl-CoA reductase/2-hydroxyglutaryl-CoA dehydratase subunit BcrC/BadD/HgdB